MNAAPVGTLDFRLAEGPLTKDRKPAVDVGLGKGI